MVLKALAIMKEEATLILVGDGSEMDVLKALAKELGIENRTLFVGGQDNPYKYMSKAAIYLSASNSEGFPNALVEAMICGCAIVSTDCPSGPREILAPESDILSLMKEGIEYAPYGTLVAVDDTVALSESLDTLLSDYTKIEAYQKASMKRAMQFRLDAICQQYSTTFKRVIEEGRK
jgi:N-acetylgalactosamine-N,N'-diacetylbacillosaminyl-diphospho-undecaprenol 4-alpha-N-acetylgalactosaminyltransferase